MSATTDVQAGAEVQNLLDESQWTGKIYSDGWVDAPTQIETTEPATGEVLGTAGGGDPESVARAATSAAAAQRAWAATSFADRAAIVRRAAELMEKHRAELIHWLIRESGAIPPKTKASARTSISTLGGGVSRAFARRRSSSEFNAK